MPISGTKTTGCKDLLKLMKDDELFSLADTVTKKQVEVARSKKEAVKAILSFSTSVEELLNRQKINRDMLFKYLMTKKVFPSVSSKKADLIMEVLKLWANDAQVQPHSPQASALPTQSSSPRSTSGQAFPAVEVNSQSTLTSVSSPTINYIVSNQYNVVNVNSPSNTDPGVQKLGENFTRWFFDALNSHNPSKSLHTKDFGPHHFLDDAELLLLVLGPSETRDRICGQQAVCDRFLAFVKGEDLLFNPNCDHGGIMVDTNPHGLVVVLVCGTVHRGNHCLGVFEQMFGLIKDPRFDNNWKIKISKLKMHAMAVSQLPRLTDKSPEEIQDLAVV